MENNKDEPCIYAKEAIEKMRTKGDLILAGTVLGTLVLIVLIAKFILS